jgi:hypothetical protein
MRPDAESQRCAGPGALHLCRRRARGRVRCRRRAVGEVAGLAGLYARQHLPLCRAVALALIGAAHSGDILTACEELAAALLRRLLGPPSLHQDIACASANRGTLIHTLLAQRLHYSLYSYPHG